MSEIRKSIVRSLRWTAADLVCYLGPQAWVAKILEKLEIVYRAVASCDVLM